MDSVKAAVSADTAVIKRGEEMMSLEGVEERVEMASAFIITLTQGGKYRIYNSGGFCGKPNCKCHESALVFPQVFNTKEEAVKELGRALMTQGLMLRDPKGLIGLLFGKDE